MNDSEYQVNISPGNVLGICQAHQTEVSGFLFSSCLCVRAYARHNLLIFYSSIIVLFFVFFCEPPRWITFFFICLSTVNLLNYGMNTVFPLRIPRCLATLSWNHLTARRSGPSPSPSSAKTSPARTTSSAALPRSEIRSENRLEFN